MAISATIVLDRSQAPRTQKVRALLTVSNSGANPVTILDVLPFVQNSAFPEPQLSSAAIGKVVANVVIPAVTAAVAAHYTGTITGTATPVTLTAVTPGAA